MDTIIYFYKKRNLTAPVAETVRMKDYLLIRVGVDVGEERWFSQQLSREEEKGEDISGQGRYVSEVFGSEEKGGSGKESSSFGRRGFYAWRERRRREKNRRRSERRARKNREQAGLEIRAFLEEMEKLIDDRYECRCAYADGVRKCLVVSSEDAQSDLALLWQQCWPFPEFDGYLEPFWVEMLLKQATLPHFVALGIAHSTAWALESCARRMKSLRWFLREKDCTREVQDVLEDFYGEYGLAAGLQTLDGERAFARLLLETTQPVCVLDFSGEPYVPSGGLARGSIWLDFCSIEEKARRILEREEGISYFSVKEIWKRAGKS